MPVVWHIWMLCRQRCAMAVDIETAFGEALVQAGMQDERVVVLDADLADSCMTEAFYRLFPGRAFDLGVAEQSLPTFAAGLALVGKIPICNTFAAFAVHRSLDMIRVSVAYNRANVKIAGHAAGHSLGYAGPSHHALEDVGALRGLPGMVILAPADEVETRQMVHWMVDYDGPVYLRLTRATVLNFHAPDYRFHPGQTERVREGRDLSIFTSGDLISLALEVRDQLQAERIDAQVVNVPCLKPLPAEAILRYGRETRAAITIEDHNIYGGLGSAVAEIYAEHLRKPLRRVGIPDTFTESDDRPVLLEAYGISLEACLGAARELVGK
jgi:transketolase